MTKLNHSDVTLLNKESVYNGFFTINRYKLKHRMFDGGETRPLVRECFERGHAVGVLAYDPWRDSIVLLQQFRIGAYVNDDTCEGQSPWLLEVIAGIVEPGEAQEEVAHREAFEEAGCSLLALEAIGEFYSSPGGSSETTQLYCACVRSDGVAGIHGLEEEGEDIRVQVITYEEAIQWLKAGRLNNASAMISMQWLMLNHDNIQRQWLQAFAEK